MFQFVLPTLRTLQKAKRFATKGLKFQEELLKKYSALVKISPVIVEGILENLKQKFKKKMMENIRKIFQKKL